MRPSTGQGVDIVCAIAVNCIWGLAFVIPKYLSELDPALVALGRYFFYGMLSAAILVAAAAARGMGQVPWARAFAYAFIGHVGYYMVLVWSISRGGIMVVAPIMATLPVSVAVVGNVLNKDLDFRRLVVPLLLILAGITSLRIYQNSQAALQHVQVRDMVYGALLALGALSMWTAYAVLNARYLKRSQISSVTWAQAMGLCCLLQVLIGLPLWLAFQEQRSQALEWASNVDTLARFLAGILVLGVVVSWFATQVWNRVSRRLPITVTGQLLVVQSLAAIVYGSWLERQLPQWIELLCVVAVVVGVVWGVKAAYEPAAKGVQWAGRS